MTPPVEIPSTEIALRALELLMETTAPAIMNHSMRTYLHAYFAGQELEIRVDAELLYLACILHDIGTAERFNGGQRFEVDGADAAAGFLIREGLSEAGADVVWQAIALHTSPGIAERRTGIVQLTRLGVRADFGGRRFGTSEQQGIMDNSLPRLEIETVLANAVIEQALIKPDKAPPASWPGLLVAEYRANPQPPGTRSPVF